VSVEGSRSAEPLTSWGTCPAAHWITCCDAFRVATLPSSGLKRGTSESQASGIRPSITRSSSAASSAWASRKEASRFSQSSTSSLPRPAASLNGSRASSGT
jgi:hypothetical protein